MPDYNKEHTISNTITMLRFPLAVAVVFSHSPGVPDIDLNQIHLDPFSGMSIYSLIRICFTRTLTHIAVPTFYFVSGYLFFFKLNEWNFSVYLTKMRKRIFTLLLPYILWNLIALAMKFIVYSFKDGGINELITLYDQTGWLSIFWKTDDTFGTPINGPLWFIRNLIIVSILSPIVYLFVRYTKYIWILFLAALYVLNIKIPITGLSVITLFFFSAGAFFSLNNLDFVSIFRRYRFLSYIMATLFLIPTIWFNRDSTYLAQILFSLYVIFGICAAFNIASSLVLKNIKPNTWLSNTSFFIYASHMVYLLLSWDIVLNYIIPSNSILCLYIKYFSMPILGTLSCLVIYTFMQKFMPKMLAILTGNRN